MIHITYVNEKGGGLMSIKCAMLGLLSWKPLTGYDLKKNNRGFFHNVLVREQ